MFTSVGFIEALINWLSVGVEGIFDYLVATRRLSWKVACVFTVITCVFLGVCGMILLTVASLR